MGTARLRVGVIGLGRMGQIHARHLAELPQAELVVVGSRRPAVAERLARELGVEWADSYEAVLERRDLDAVVIATATCEHVSHVIHAAERGRAIFCEKPIALTLEDTDRALDAVRRAGVPLMVGFMRRFDPPYARAKELIEAGAIGRPVMYKGVNRDPRWPAHEDDDPAVSGGFFVDMGVHDYDLAWWLMDSPIVRVHAIGGALVYPQLATVGDVDNGLVNVEFASGAVGNIDVSRNARYGYDIRTEILGDEGALWIGTIQQTPLLVLDRTGVRHDVYPWFPERFATAFRNEMLAFVTGVLADKPLSPSGEDSRRALAVALAVKRSYTEGRPVPVGGAQEAST